ncbi:MAG: hypothetical protein ACRDH9_03960 [Actinomycetota bacterium]
MYNGIPERLTQDGVESSSIGLPHRGIKGPELAGVSDKFVSGEAADLTDIATDPTLVVSSRSRGKIAFVIAIPVVDDVGDSQAAALETWAIPAVLELAG